VPLDIRIRPTCEGDQQWIRKFTLNCWGAEFVVAHGLVYLPHQLPGFVAEDTDGTVLGFASYLLEPSNCELVTINAVQQGRGIGTALLSAIIAAATQAGCTRLWLITTNGNLDALAFYQKRGFQLVAIHRNALDRSRQLKPVIPLVSENGIPLRDEIELELLLVQ
jgi:N-acetylglutamate synthase-like GNAT family acetyltransferase